MAKVPVIDFSKKDLKPGSPEWDLVKSQVQEAVEVYGCFEALVDQVLELRKPVFGALEELSDLHKQKSFVFPTSPFVAILGTRPDCLKACWSMMHMLLKILNDASPLLSGLKETQTSCTLWHVIYNGVFLQVYLALFVFLSSV
ncbi:hypothetical protein HRI_002213200 [Hibiscus trionum]|uniref:Non-haem dioxygenase N-terminal domain-containing protein n=1 Tax=Hibiscus trionum TaxID=183268 RepID=A0A9W7HW31_HIBTR|nr:hypothetical protein HRI_002213200 [Hibiscus trionum]